MEIQEETTRRGGGRGVIIIYLIIFSSVFCVSPIASDVYLFPSSIGIPALLLPSRVIIC